MCSEMSWVKDENVKDNSIEGRIDTNLITRTTTKVHRIRWTIEDFSQLALHTKTTSPDFYLAKTCVCNISFRKTLQCQFVYLRNKSDGSIKIKRHLILSDCEGETLHEDKTENLYTIEKDKEVSMITAVDVVRLNSLKDDILIIDCILNVEGSITTKSCSFKSERETRGNLIKDLKTMFNNPVDSDFTLQIGNEIIHSHKSLLRARSAYFKRIFETQMEESVENSVTISDVPYLSMQKLIEFLYTGDFTETLDNNIQMISDLYFAADKYEVLELRSLCADKLMSAATANSACQILQLAHNYNDDDLKMRAMNFIYSYFDEIEKTSAWKALISSEIALGSEVLSFCFKQFKCIP